MASSSKPGPCAACSHMRRKCTKECVLAPYFPANQPEKFKKVHKAFGACNVSNILKGLNPRNRQEAADSLIREAEARQKDPVYGIVGVVYILQQRLKQLNLDLFKAKKALSTYIGPSAMLPLSHQQQHFAIPSSVMGMPPAPSPQSDLLIIREPQQQRQMLNAQQIAAAVAAREQQEEEMLRIYEQQQQQQQFQNQQQQSQQQQLLSGQFDSTALPLWGQFDNPFLVQQQQSQLPQQLHQQSESYGSDEGT